MFLSKWLSAPLLVASITPSSASLARAMAAALPDQRTGVVVELGGGTGAITHALLQAGVAPRDVVVIERDPHFCEFLAARLEGITVLRGDALRMAGLLRANRIKPPVRAVVSGLPLLSMNSATQMRLLRHAIAVTEGTGPFIQFSYGLGSPLRKSVSQRLCLRPECVAQVWRNLPPAKVWTYQCHTFNTVRCEAQSVAQYALSGRLRADPCSSWHTAAASAAHRCSSAVSQKIKI